MLLDTALGDPDANLADFVGAFGLIECAPTVADLKFDLVRALLEGAAGCLIGDEGAAIGVAFGLAVERQVKIQSGVPFVAIQVRDRQTSGGFLRAIDAPGGHQVHLGLESVGGDADFAARVLELLADVLIIEPGRDSDPDGVLDADFGVNDFELLQVAVVQDDIGVGGEAELDFEIVEALFVGPHGAYPGAFCGEFLLFEPAEVGLGDAAFTGEGASAFGVFS